MTRKVAALTKGQALMKRAFDVVLSAILIILLAPTLLGVAFAVRFSGPGPILYRYRRFSPAGRQVTISRFRTMRIEPINTPLEPHTTRDDPRFTKVGLFLRRTALDELPQLIDVLRGQLSLVGPRPKYANEYLYYKSNTDQDIHLRPGITFTTRGISFGVTSDSADTMKRIYALEKDYVENWSLWLDLKIIGQTLSRSFFSSNAY